MKTALIAHWKAADSNIGIVVRLRENGVITVFDGVKAYRGNAMSRTDLMFCSEYFRDADNARAYVRNLLAQYAPEGLSRRFGRSLDAARQSLGGAA